MKTPQVTNEAACDICIALEQMIDRSSVQQVLERLEAVLYAKADHIADNWQDLSLAREWERIARAVAVATRRATQAEVPGITMSKP